MLHTAAVLLITTYTWEAKSRKLLTEFWPEFKNHFPFALNSSEKIDISHFQDRYKKLIKNILFESFFWSFFVVEA
jgi:hypothetical protein